MTKEDNGDRHGDIFDLDVNNLDQEWADQARFYFHFAKKLADARRDQEQARVVKEIAKAELKEATAELELAIRRDPQKYGVDKLTESAVEKTAILQPRYKEVQKAFFNTQRDEIKAQHHADVMKAKVEGLDHRKYALTNLTSLDARNYFSRTIPRTDEETRERINEAKDRHAFGRRNRE
jgi:hypothetical protein